MDDAPLANGGIYMWEIILTALAVILLSGLGSEECRLGLRRLQGTLRERPRLKIALYPLGAALLLLMAGLLANSIVKLIGAMQSYD